MAHHALPINSSRLRSTFDALAQIGAASDLKVKFLSWRVHLLVIGAYTLLTVIFTYPLAFQIGAVLPGRPPDTYLYAWDLEWVKRILLGVDANLYFTNAMYYPTGVGLYFHQLILGTNVLALPLQLAFGLASTYVVMTLAMFVVSGYGAFLLAYQVVRHFGAAFFAGMVFTFSPYHLTHLFYAHFDLMGIQWLPLFALATIKLLKQPNGKFLVLALIFLVWNSITDWYYALYAVLFFGLYVLSQIIRNRSVKPLVPALMLGVAYAITLSWLFLPMLNEIRQGGANLRGVSEADKFSADLLAFVTPSVLHPLWGSVVAPLANQFKGGFVERTVFVGYTTLAFVFGALLLRRLRESLFWLIGALVFFILALGPVLHIAGQTEFGGREILLPYALIYRIPLLSTVFDIARSIGRFSVMGLLCLVIVAAFGIKALSLTGTGSGAPRKYLPLLWVFACVAVGIEFVVVPVFTTSVAVPPAVNALATDSSKYAVLDLPADFGTGGEAMYFWTIDQKPTTNGYHSQLLPFPLFDSLRVFRPLLDASHPDDIITTPNPTAAQVLNFFDVRVIALHKQETDPDIVSRAARWIRENFNNPIPFANDDRLTLYDVPPANAPPFVIMLAGEWYPPSQWSDGKVWRWMANDARVLIYAQQPMTVSFRVDTISLGEPRTLDLGLNGTNIDDEAIADDLLTRVELPALTLHAGENELQLHCVEPAEQPAALGIGNDPRFLAIAFSNLAVKVVK